MAARLKDVARDLRARIAEAVEDHERGLVDELATASSGEATLDGPGWQDCGTALLGLLRLAVTDGDLDAHPGRLDAIASVLPPLGARELIHALHRLERLVVDELALHPGLGATSDQWPLVTHCVRAASLEVIIAFVERDGSAVLLRDRLTTLMTRAVFDLVLQQESQRALRHRHGISMILFDIDALAELNQALGFGAGDRLLERMGILARRYFRTHDWVARHGADSIAVLLPETTLDQASSLAERFVQMVHQRLVLVDHKTDDVRRVTVSAAAVGTDLVDAEIDPGYVLAEAEGAVLRAKMNGGNRVERVSLLPSSVTLVGAATLLGLTVREVMQLVHDGALRATRRGRHFYIDRLQIDDYRASRH